MEIQALIDELIKHEHEQRNCVTIYLDSHKTNFEAQQDPVRLKTMISESKKKLANHNVDDDQIDSILKPAVKLLNDDDFWLHQKEGLGLFLSHDISEIKKLPADVKSEVHVGDQFYITPLVKFLNNEKQYHALSITKKNIRLFSITADEIEKLEIDNIPQSYDEFKQYHDEEKSLNSGTQDARGNKTAMHGHGDASKSETVYEREYVKQVENGVTAYLRDHQTPLLLIGVESIASKYRNVNNYEYLMEATVQGNHDAKSAKELHQMVWPVIEVDIQSNQKENVGQFADQLSTETTIDDIDEIHKAADYGQVDTLYITNQIDDEMKPVVNNAVIETIRNSGTVLHLEKSDLPGNREIASLLRYPLAV